jgi:hypothetical protein
LTRQLAEPIRWFLAMPEKDNRLFRARRHSDGDEADEERNRKRAVKCHEELTSKMERRRQGGRSG